MFPALRAALLADLPGMISLGPLRVPLFGVLAALGVIAALLLSQRTARHTSVSPSALWDAGMVLVAASFLASRLLLILAAPQTFRRVPVTVLLLPSLTPFAVLLACAATLLWLRWKRLPLREVLDAWAPCVAVFFAVLSLAHLAEGTDAGMPTRLPWGVVTPGDHILGRVHPVQLYAFAAWLAIAAVTLRVLHRRSWSGEAAAWALALGGTASFLLDLLRQPAEVQGDSWLEPGQYLALVAAAAGAWQLLRPRSGVGAQPYRTTAPDHTPHTAPDVTPHTARHKEIA